MTQRLVRRFSCRNRIPGIPAVRSTATAFRAAVIGIALAAGSTVSAGTIPNDPPASKPAEPRPTADLGTPRLELHIPSFADLASAARVSKTADLYRALSGLFPKMENETDEGFDPAAVTALLSRMAGWPDTAVTLAAYSLDRDGRPRWALRVNWPASDLAARIEDILSDESARQLLKNIELNKHGAIWRLELPDLVLAELSAAGEGAVLSSDSSVVPPDKVFGMQEAADARARDREVPVLFCNLNLDAGSADEKSRSMFGSIAGLTSLQYWITPRDDGRWREDFAATWSPLLGAALKAVFQKAKKQYDCPRGALLAGVINLGAMTETMPDSLTGLPAGTLSPHLRGDLVFSVAPGTGFLPFPDVFFQFRSASGHFIYDDVRAHIKKDNEKRSDEDERPAWHEIEVDGRPVFWLDPTADVRGMMISPATYRTVLFVEERDEGDAKVSHLIIAQTSGWAEEAVQRWKELTARGKTVKIPSSKKIHWQARIHWKELYALAQPYLGMAAAFVSGSSMPPEASELGEILSDAVIDLNIGLGGVRARHQGPVPLGMIYVPAVTAMSFATTADATSEASREQSAARHLRVLHHHARLFRKDFGRWPANVAELDGYVDFASHPDLLRLTEMEKTFGADIAAALFGGAKARTTASEDEAERAIDDTLYVIQWSAGDDWRLCIRDGEFKNHKTLCIDAGGNIHRVPLDKPTTAAADSAPKATQPSGDAKPAEDKAGGPASDAESRPDEKPDAEEKPKEEPKPRKKPILL